MRRKIIIIGVACLMLVRAAIAVNAQDQQRKVTPVKPKTNKVMYARGKTKAITNTT